MGGPVCTGRIYKRVLEPLGADQTTSIQQHSETDIHVVCPWHGYEFDLVTGAHPGGSRRLRKIELEVSDGNVHALF
jgi:nitrite reductase/ring-hydroxylating ferredoxin subunit